LRQERIGALSSVAFESRSALEPLFAFPGVVPPHVIVAIGGGTRNRVLLVLKATVLNRPITVLDLDEATALGAALLGGIGAGVYADIATALSSLRFSSSVVEADPHLVDFYDTLFRDIYQSLYPTFRTLHHRLLLIGERDA
jgi:xylulokinase